MPAQLEEVVDAEAEAIEMDFLSNPLKVLGEDGRVIGLRCIKTELGDFDDSGRRRPIPVGGSEYTIKADLIIPCLGQKLTMGFTGGKINLDRRGHFAVDAVSMATNLPGVFAAGDAINPSTVIESVAQGRKAAIAIDRFLGYDGRLFEKERQPVTIQYNEEEYLKNIPRKKIHHEKVEKRIMSLALEVNQGLLLDEAVEEARRCLHCDRNQPVVTVEKAEAAYHIEEML
jgi:heterodisulfide reductase subunit A-like polyferredoxin